MYEYHSVLVESEDSKRTTEGIITSFNNDYLIMLNESKTELNINERVNINIFCKIHGCMNYEGIIKTINENVIEIHYLAFIHENQRRKHPRIKVNIPLNITRIQREDGDDIELSKPILMKAKNISISGILLESPLDIPEDIEFRINIPLESDSLDLTTNTVRKYKENDLFYYGCSFGLNDECHNEILRKFIYKNYLKQIYHKSPNFPVYNYDK